MENRIRIFLSVWMTIFFFFVMTESMISGASNVYREMPDKLSGWVKSDSEKVYTPDNLYEYIDGNAELFISYKFKKLYSFSFEKEGDEITVDIFDMGNSANAYGIFSNGREREDSFVSGDIDSEYSGGLLTFWKGRYFISILAYPETEESKKVVRKTALILAGNFQGDNTKPTLVRLLPRDHIEPFSIKYFYHYVWLNSYYFVSNENILKLGEGTEAVLAKYYPDGKENRAVILLLTRYPDDRRSADAFSSFQKFLVKKKLKKVNNSTVGSNIKAVIKSNLIGIVFNYGEENYADDLLTKSGLIDKGDK